MVYYAVIDTNVLVSALLTRHEDASPLQVVKRLFRGDIIPLYDEEIVGEYAEVLRRPKFHFSETLVATMLQTIITYLRNFCGAIDYWRAVDLSQGSGVL